MAKFVVKKNRLSKAKKIERILCDFKKEDRIHNAKILDIGCGNGEIIQYFCKNDNEVYAVDVMDQRSGITNLYNFKLVNSSILPYKSGMFDIIISNHVIEHMQDQNLHMSEIYRCLKPKGICYFTTPNWNYFIEPHHNIPFLHYLGKNLFHKALKLLHIYEEDLYLLSYKQMKNIFIKYNYKEKEFTSEVLKKPERYYLTIKFTRYLPKWFYKIIIFLSPNNIFILTKE